MEGLEIPIDSIRIMTEEARKNITQEVIKAISVKIIERAQKGFNFYKHEFSEYEEINSIKISEYFISLGYSAWISDGAFVTKPYIIIEWSL